MKNYYFFFFTFFIVVSCSRQVDNSLISNVFMNQFGEVLELEGKKVALDTVWRPNRIYCSDSVLFIVDKTTDRFVTAYDIYDCRRLSSNLRMGNGPNELLSCWTLQIDKNTNCINVLDVMSKKINKYNYRDFISKSDVAPLSSTSFTDIPVYLIQNSRGAFISSVLSDNNSMLTVCDSNGNRTNFECAYPTIYSSVFQSERENKLCYQCRVFYNEIQHRVIVTYDYWDMIDIYDDDLNLLHRIRGPYMLEPEMVGDGTTYYPSDETPFSFESCSLTSDRIFVLYNGTLDDEFFDTVLSFDYDGVPKGYYHLDVPVLDICVHEGSRMIYGLADNPECCVMKYEY